jgi:hypothetical protein
MTMRELTIHTAAAVLLLAAGPASAQPGTPDAAGARAGPTTGGSGSSTAPAAGAAEPDVRATLAGRGYDEILNLRPVNGGWTAQAMKNGKPVILEIDKSGKITEK